MRKLLSSERLLSILKKFKRSMDRIIFSCIKPFNSLALIYGTICSTLCLVFILTSCTHNVSIKKMEFKPNSEQLPYTVGIKVPKQVVEFVYDSKNDESVRAELGQGLKLNAYRAFKDCFNKVVDLSDAKKNEDIDYEISFEIGKIEYLSEWRSDVGALGGMKRLVSVELIGIVSDRTGKELFRQNGFGKVECVRWECRAKNDTYERNSAVMIAQTLILGVGMLHSNVTELISYSFETSLKNALEECRIKLIEAMRSTSPPKWSAIDKGTRQL